MIIRIKDIARQIAYQTDKPVGETVEFINILFDKIKEDLQDRHKVHIKNFGTFFLGTIKPRTHIGEKSFRTVEHLRPKVKFSNVFCDKIKEL